MIAFPKAVASDDTHADVSEGAAFDGTAVCLTPNPLMLEGKLTSGLTDVIGKSESAAFDRALSITCTTREKFHFRFSFFLFDPD